MPTILLNKSNKIIGFMLSRPVSRAYSKNRLLLGESLKISLTLVKEEFPGKLEFEVA